MVFNMNLNLHVHDGAKLLDGRSPQGAVWLELCDPNNCGVSVTLWFDHLDDMEKFALFAAESVRRAKRQAVEKLPETQEIDLSAAPVEYGDPFG